MLDIKNKIINYKCNISSDLIKKYNIVSCDTLEKDMSVTMIVWNNNEVFREEYFALFPNLRLFVNWGTATSNLPEVEHFIKRSIILKTVKGYSTNAVAEYVIFTLMKLFSRSSEKRKELSGKKVGIVGMGNIGKRVVKFLMGFDCEIGYFSRTKKDISIPFYSLEDLVVSVDALVIAVDSKDFTIPISLLQRRQKELVICNISQDRVFPAFKVIQFVRERNLPLVDIISDNFVEKEIIEHYGKYYTPHVAYQSLESSLIKNSMLEKYIALL